MPRAPRVDLADAVYHVTSRGNARADVFLTDDDPQRFLGQLAHHLELTGVLICAYVVMDNHFHLLVRTPRANLSAFMDLPRWTVPLGEIDAAVSRHFGTDPGVLSSHGHHAGPAKAVASRLAEATGRQIGLHYGIGSSAVRATDRRLADRPGALEIVEPLVQQLRSKRVKYKV